MGFLGDIISGVTAPMTGVYGSLVQGKGPLSGIPAQAGGFVGQQGFNMGTNALNGMGIGGHGGNGGNQYPNPWSTDGSGNEYSWGVPVPKYNAIDPSQYKISDQIKANLGNVQDPDMKGLQANRDEALRSGLSKGSLLAMEQSRLEEAQQRDNLAGSTMGQAAGARSALAMRGGMGSGARERIGLSAARTGALGQQNIGAEAAKNRLGIGMQDESNRLSMLRGLGGIENQYAQTGLEKARIGSQGAAIDAGNYIKSQQDKNAWEQQKYASQMGLLGAQQTALATANSGGGGFLDLFG